MAIQNKYTIIIYMVTILISKYIWLCQSLLFFRCYFIKSNGYTSIQRINSKFQYIVDKISCLRLVYTNHINNKQVNIIYIMIC